MIALLHQRSDQYRTLIETPCICNICAVVHLYIYATLITLPKLVFDDKNMTWKIFATFSQTNGEKKWQNGKHWKNLFLRQKKRKLLYVCVLCGAFYSSSNAFVSVFIGFCGRRTKMFFSLFSFLYFSLCTNAKFSVLIKVRCQFLVWLW